MYLTFKTKNAFEVKWYSIKFEFLVSLNYSLLVDVMAQKKQFLQVENLRQRLKKYVEVSSILNLIATVTQQTGSTNYSVYSFPLNFKNFLSRRI